MKRLNTLAFILCSLCFYFTNTNAQSSEFQQTNELNALLFEKAGEHSTLSQQRYVATELIIFFEEDTRPHAQDYSKQQLIDAFALSDIELMRDYSRLPMSLIKAHTHSALLTLLQNPRIKAIYRNEPLQLHLNQSLALINSEPLHTSDMQGNGSTIAILDSGVDHTQSAFGNCSAPGIPASCRVSVSLDIAADDGSLDSNGHGSHVAAIAAATAPGAKIVALDIISPDGSLMTADVIAGIDWSIANQAAYNIKAINLSLGSTTTFTSPCNNFNPFSIPVANARAAGIVVLASSGNQADSNGMSIPACTPEVISVGAVYDANVGGLSWGVCQDNTTAADQIGCFSNSASFLDLLAPGALITATGSTLGGTSQAAPHASGTIAILASAYPNASVAALEQQLLRSTTQITDPRNSVTTPRLSLPEALGAVNNDFANAIPLNANVPTSQTRQMHNIDADKQSGEPDHAGIAGGASLWWALTPETNATVCLNTQGSTVDTVLAVYTGVSILSLQEVLSNNDANSGTYSQLCFQADAKQQYFIVVDSLAATRGNIMLQLDISAAMIAAQIPMLPLWAAYLLAICLMGIAVLVKFPGIRPLHS